MKVLEAKNADLSNFEVQQHLAEMHARSKSGPKKRGMLGNLATVVKEVLEYLHTSPNPLADQEKNQHYGPETVRLLLEKLRDANLSNDLTKGEILSIVNIRPFNDVLLDTVIEDMSERFSPEEQDQILAIIAEVLGQSEQDEEPIEG